MLSLTVQREEFPYRYVTVEGSVIESSSSPSADQMLAIVGRYLPEEAARGFVEAELAHPGPGPVHFTIRPDRWLTSTSRRTKRSESRPWQRRSQKAHSSRGRRLLAPRDGARAIKELPKA